MNVTFYNNNGEELTIARDENAMHWLESIKGVYDYGFNLNTGNNATFDGSSYNSAHFPQRNIVITGLMYKDVNNFDIERKYLRRFFKIRESVKIVIEVKGVKYLIVGYTESIDIDTFNRLRKFTLSVICPNPYFVLYDKQTVIFTGKADYFTFSHEFSSGGEILSEILSEPIKTVISDGESDETGIVAKFTAAKGSVINPFLYHIEKDETMRFTFDMQIDDVIEIDTSRGDKNIFLTRNNVRTKMNYIFDETSNFIQLSRGINTLKYDADSDVDNLEFSIAYDLMFMGL